MIKETIGMIFPVFSTPTWVAAFIIPALAMFAPIAVIVHAVLALIIIDNITGIMASFRRSGLKFCIFCASTWRHIESKKLGQTITKMLAYVLLIISAFLIDQYIIQLDTSLFFTKVVSASIAFREIMSILENTEALSGKSLITLVFSFIKNGFKKGIIEDIEDKQKKKDK